LRNAAAPSALVGAERGVERDARDLLERALDLEQARDHRRRVGIGRLEQDDDVLAGAEDLLERPRALEIRIGRHDQAIERVVLLDRDREVRRRHAEQGVEADDQPAHPHHAAEHACHDRVRVGDVGGGICCGVAGQGSTI